MPAEKLPLLLATKVLPPRLPAGLIDRPRLFDLAIHDAMSFFIANAPSHVHVIVCTRADPPLPLARLRAQNGLL